MGFAHGGCAGWLVAGACVVIGIGGCGDDATGSAPDLGRPPTVEALLAEMTLEEKVGQMTMAELDQVTDEEIAEYHLGALLTGATGTIPGEDTVGNVADAYDGAQTAALRTRLSIPLLYGVDAVHGHNNVVGATIFPHNIGLGASGDPALVEEVARATAVAMRATGMQWNFAPCVGVARDERWGRTYESFSEDPELVRELGAAAIRGYQTDDLRNPLAVLATAKHFVADGGTEGGANLGNADISEEELRGIHLVPYQDVAELGLGSIMPSYTEWQGEELTTHRNLLTDVLKTELGFEGVVISDYEAIRRALPTDYELAVERAINAGVDMGMVVDRHASFIETLIRLVETDRVPEARIDDAVRRILRVKLALGMLDEDPRLFADRTLHERVGSAEHRDIARRAVRESLVLLKNEGSALPLTRTATRIHLAGKNADDLAHQCGGWTIDLQGNRASTTEGTTIREAIEAAASPETEVTFSIDGTGAAGADVGVVVIGEENYAETNGDRDDLSLDSEDVAAVEAVAGAGIPVVVVLVSGRPMILGSVADTADAIVAAWLPGTEGQGVADVLFGDHAPTAKLSFTWPRSMDQIPLNVGDEPYDPLFPFGHGLTYE